MFALNAPAKINLTLEVLGKRQDGYHDITSVIQTISLSDIVEFEPSNSFTFSCDDVEWEADKSLVSSAAFLFAKHIGTSNGARIHVHKRIPFSAGLGGESSAAAITLAGLNNLFKAELAPGELYHLAEKLGSDVPFFLTGGTALVSGRGEKVSPLPAFPHHWVILLVPADMGTHRKTEQMYSRLQMNNYTTGILTDNFISSLTLGKMKNTPELYNVFEEVAAELFDKYGWYEEQFYLAGAKRVNMAGSGPVLFSLETDRDLAEQVVLDLNQRGLKAILTQTIDCNGYDSLI